MIKYVQDRQVFASRLQTRNSTEFSHFKSQLRNHFKTKGRARLHSLVFLGFWNLSFYYHFTVPSFVVMIIYNQLICRLVG